MIVAVSFVACDKDDNDTPSIETPTDYSFLRNGESTVSFVGQTTRLAMGEELASNLLNFDQTATTLLEMYANETASGGDANPFSNVALNESTKSIKSKVAASVDFFANNASEASIIKADFETWINAQVTEIFPFKDQLATVGVAGQIADGTTPRYVNGKGLEYDQAVIKGLIGALVVDQMLNNYLSPAVLDEADNRANNDNTVLVEEQNYTVMEHKWDEAYGYLFGLSTDAANPLATLGEDSYLNKYLNRVRNDDDFSDFDTRIFDAFKLGRAAIVAGDYEIRDAQADIIKDLVSQVVAIRAVYYLQQAKIAYANNEFGTAFHDLSEGFGFIYSLRFLPSPNGGAYFTKAEVDAYLEQLLAGDGFWDLTDETLDAISESIANKFPFTLAQAGS